VSRLAALVAFLLLFALNAVPAVAQAVPDDEAPPSTKGLFIGLGMLAFVLVAIPLGQRITRRRREAAPRLPRVRSARAAAEARAEDLSIPEIRADGEELFREVQSAWDARDKARLQMLVAPQLLGRWEAARAAREEFWAFPVEIDGRVEVEYVGTGSGPTGARQVLLRFQTQLDGFAPRSKPLPRKRFLR
jgi:hypothetical protein